MGPTKVDLIIIACLCAACLLIGWAFSTTYYADRQCAQLGGINVAGQCIDRAAILPERE